MWKAVLSDVAEAERRREVEVGLMAARALVEVELRGLSAGGGDWLRWWRSTGARLVERRMLLMPASHKPSCPALSACVGMDGRIEHGD